MAPEEQAMATAARDRLARTLRADAKSTFGAELTARPECLSLEVEGCGRVTLPVTPAKARKLISLAEPARFGRGSETLTDPDVRHTWEIPRHLVRAEWDDAMLTDFLATVKEELGLPNAAGLTADLHSLLVYEPDQFFLPHQDSEKSDDMVATLVVTLPSSHAGGELVVEHNGERSTYRGSKTTLSLVAFYTDCRHEVLKVKSGYRITLTYNLLLHGDTTRPEGDDGTAAELASLLREHFATPTHRYHGGPPAAPPGRLAYLLDHEYTPRALAWSRLKGEDARRVSLLRAAADRAGCEAILALADVKETHDAYPADEVYGYRRRGWHDTYDYCEDDEYSGASDNEREYVTQDLVDSEITLTHWTGPDGARLEETSLFLHETEVCESTPSGDLQPYSRQYEGYMGNWGNTLDRWYHRAAVVVWPREQAFANRAETSAAWALDQIAAMASSADVAGARAAAATLAPFWDVALRGQAAQQKQSGKTSGLLRKALLAAQAVADAATAAMLLSPFRIDSLAAAHVKSLTKTAERYGEQWTAELLRTWFGGDQPGWAFGAGHDVPQWAADQLPGLCERLRAAGSAGAAAAERLLDLAWERIATDIGAAVASSRPSYRDRQLGDLGKPLAAVLTAAAAIGAASRRDTVAAHLRQQDDPVTALEMSALRASAATPRDYAPGDGGFDALASDCAARLRGRLARPEREPGDWSVELPAGSCACELCGTLRVFLADKNARTFEWPLAQTGRQHVHSRIDAAELPVTHVTRRQGRPYTLVLAKTDMLFGREQEARARDETDLAWLADQWTTEPATATRGR
jgi:predicted 2-oxoglutarate/Fe(II)-dependent dioxygenase YbiX